MTRFPQVPHSQKLFSGAAGASPRPLECMKMAEKGAKVSSSHPEKLKTILKISLEPSASKKRLGLTLGTALRSHAFC